MDRKIADYKQYSQYFEKGHCDFNSTDTHTFTKLICCLISFKQY